MNNEDHRIEVVEVEGRPGQLHWRICSGGSCLVNRNLVVLMEAYRALLISQGRLVGDQ